MKKLYKEKPILACVLTVLIFCFVLFMTSLMISLLVKILHINVVDDYPFMMIQDIIAAIVGFLLIKVSDQTYIFRKPNITSFFKGLVTGGYLIVLSLYACIYMFILYIGSKEGLIDSLTLQQAGLNFSNYQLLSLPHILCFTIYMICIGMAEEFFFRGIIAEKIMHVFKKQENGVYKAIILSGILFGSTHLINAFSTGLLSAFVQAIQTSILGMILVIVYYKNQNIWSNVFIHAFLDFFELAMLGGIFGSANQVNSISSAMNYGIENLISVIPFALVTLVLIRGKNINQIKQNYE